ncbi:hypothetical protein OOU_Y34scaffold00619g31 [Pyricularia oryzae Y34]|uniref:WSC domain-containing protein n=1 Tax=Pyricularia oryzae (strain Y34) TaxID=1143189 RepID=A0AA97PJT8_PYRO3|nr:hypothetical protein OOU_Y34scaffold00619g31 [Pyricularia oryzae Y34]
MRGLSAAALCAVAGSLMMPVMAAPGDAPLDGEILMIIPGDRVDFYDPAWPAQYKQLADSPHYRTARSLGYTVSNVTTDEWSELTEADFQFFKAIFISKLGSGTMPDYSFLNENKAVWGAAFTDESNIMLSGVPVSDTAAQAEVDAAETGAAVKNAARRNARIVLNNAINFIMKGTNTGMYMEVPMTTDDNTTPELQTSGETLEFLSGFGDFKLRIFGENPPSAGAGIEEVTEDDQNVVTLVARHPDLPNLDSAILSSWDRAARSVFAQRDSEFQPFYIASDVEGLEPFPWTDKDGLEQTGPPVILVRAETFLSTPVSCGDGNVDLDEQCDAGGSIDATCNEETCLCRWGMDESDACLAAPDCGDSTAQPQLGEECDLGPDNGVSGSICTSECLCAFGGYTDSNGNYQCIQACGNGMPDGTEQCDDGVLFNGQALSLCDEECACKYGTDNDGNCQTSFCGDGDVTGDEECDFADNGAVDSLCSETCTCKYGPAENPTDEVPCAAAPTTPICGNDVVDSGEECDNAEDELCGTNCLCLYGPAENPTNEIPCAAAPATPICGNNVVDSGEHGEQCDNTEDELCGTNCLCLYGTAENPTAEIPCAAAPAAPSCGNNIVDSGEQCDNTEDELCGNDCQCIYGPATVPTTDAPCPAAPAVPPTCGNGVLESGEQCDNEEDELCGEDCVCLFGPAEEPTADAPCATAPTTPPTCGNNVVESGEQCDNEEDELCGEDCACLFGPAEEPTADAPCATAPTTPPTCGNDVVEIGEECDNETDLCNEECECVFGLNEETEECYETDQAITTTSSVPDAATTTESATATETVTESADATATEDVSATATEDVTSTESTDVTVTETATESADATATEDVSATATEDVTATESADVTVTETADATATEDVSATATEDVTATESVSATVTGDFTATESADATATEDVTATESADATATEDVTMSESGIATVTEEVTATESAGATATEDVTMSESGTATDVATLTEGNTITSAIDATQTGTNTAGTQTTTSPSSPSGTDGPLPQELQSEDGASFSFVGCAASAENYRGFTLEQESDDMDLNLCVTVCKDRLYSGAYKNQCYCGDELDESDVSIVGDAACDLTCPGNPSQNCGGDLDTTEKLRVRQVTAGILLSLYRRDIVDGSSSVAPTLVGTATLSAPLPSQTASGVTIINNNNNNINNIDIDIDINIILVPFPGVDCVGQLVYIKSCDICKAGEKVTWAPKRCANADDCAGMKVYKPEQCSDNNGRCNPGTSDYDFVVEKPCTSCDGGIIYQPKEQDNTAPHSPEHQAQPQQPGAGDVPGQHAGDDVPVTAGSGRFSAFQSLVAGFAVNVILAGFFLSGGVMVARLTTTRRQLGDLRDRPAIGNYVIRRLQVRDLPGSF